jgi:ribosomal protein L11
VRLKLKICAGQATSSPNFSSFVGRRDTQHNDTWHNDNQSSSKESDISVMMSVTILVIMSSVVMDNVMAQLGSGNVIKLFSS